MLKKEAPTFIQHFVQWTMFVAGTIVFSQLVVCLITPAGQGTLSSYLRTWEIYGLPVSVGLGFLLALSYRRRSPKV